MKYVISTTVFGVTFFLESHAQFPVWKPTFATAKTFDTKKQALTCVAFWKNKDRGHFNNHQIIEIKF